MGRLKRLDRLMLAQPYNDNNVAGMGEYIAVQPKLNGERCLAIWSEKEGRHKLISSYGIEFKFLDLESIFPEPLNYDGELYVHGWSRERIHSVVSRKVNPSPLAKDIRMYVFDVVANVPFLHRVKWLWQLGEHGVYTEVISNSPENIALNTERFVKMGYEGLIVRDLRKQYTPGRTAAMVKVKPDKVDRYAIVGVEEEIDKNGFAKNSLGSVMVVDKNGNRFSVGTGNALTQESRKRLWEKRDSLPGRIAVVKHSLIETVNGFPTCTSLVEIV